MQAATPLFSSALENFAGAPPAKFLPTSRAEMDALGWERCDIIIVTGDAYVDHPSFGMAIIGPIGTAPKISRRWARRACFSA